MTLTVLDIETAPQARALLAPYPQDERPCPSNYKDPEKIAAWHIRDEAEWRANRAKECALSPRLGRVVCVGMKSEQIANTYSFLDEAEEPQAVQYALEVVRMAGEDRDGLLVTFNGLTFDLPFLHIRAAVLGVKITYNIGAYVARYRTAPHADLRAVLTNWDQRTTGTLTEWCAAFGIDNPDQTTGADVARMVEENNAEGIRAHCAADLGITYQLAHKLRAAGMI